MGWSPFAVVVSGPQSIVIVGLTEEAVGEQPERLVWRAVDRYAAEHDNDEAFTWSDVGEVPASYFVDVGLRNVTVVRAAWAVAGSTVLRPAAEQVIPTTPPPRLERRRGEGHEL